MEVRDTIKGGDVFKTNSFGDLEVIRYENYASVLVKFKDTGFECFSNTYQITNGGVKDLLSPSVYGIGFLGGTEYRSWLNNKPTPAYEAWKGMLRRCYGTDYTKELPTYEGCSVSVDWYNFQVFAEWFYKRYFVGCHLDKDIKFKGNKVYSPDTCMLVTAKDNTTHSSVKKYSFISPDGEITSIINLAEFCRGKSLDPSSMVKLSKGKKKTHKGWKKAPDKTGEC